MLLNLHLTMSSGQPPEFVWTLAKGERYFRYLNGKKIYIWQQNGKLLCTRGFEKYAENLLRAEDDLSAIYRMISTDAVMGRALEKYRGLRLTRSDPWETLVCFICSINSNIPRIRKNVQSLMRDGEILSPEEMARGDLSACRLGYRCEYLQETARLVSSSFDLEKIGRMDYEDAREALMELPGVGPKVAECVLLFGYGFLEAFPVDVWIARAMEKYYRRKTQKEIREFARERWGEYAGYAQQYLFCYARGV
ncbi:MAG: DNA glycosylase [Candidatus Micrarchaeota archaeon]